MYACSTPFLTAEQEGMSVDVYTYLSLSVSLVLSSKKWISAAAEANARIYLGTSASYVLVRTYVLTTYLAGWLAGWLSGCEPVDIGHVEIYGCCCCSILLQIFWLALV